jgi:hypothetical protein
MSDNPFALSNINPSARPAPASDNPFSLQAIERDQQQELRNRLRAATTINPDQATEVDALARQYQVPPDVVARNLAEVKRQAAVDGANAQLRNSPVLSDAMRRQPWLAQQSHDDVGSLSRMESSVGGLADRTVLGTARDVTVTALKGAVGLPQAFVGLADIATGGRAGRLVERSGVRFADAQKMLDTMYSPAQQRSNAAMREAEGFIDTLGAMLSNPSTIATTVGEAVPQMLGGAAIGQTLIKAAPKLAPWLAAAFGEGIMGAGSAASSSREESDDGLLSAKQTFGAVMSGAGATLFGAVGARASARLGLKDIDTVLVQRGVDAASAATIKRGFVSSVVKAGISEGVFEELPQSMQEQLWSNWANDRPLGQGVGKAAAQGLLAGLAMGGGFQAATEAATRLQARLDTRAIQQDEATAYADKMQQALSAAAQSKLRERNPQTFRDLVQEMTDGTNGAPTSIYIDAEVLAQSAPELAQSLPAVAEQLQGALTAGSTIEVPIADVLTLAPGTPLEQLFLQNGRRDPDAQSLADVQAAGEQAQAFIQQEADRVLAQASDTAAWQQGTQSVQQAVLGELTAAGRFTPDVNEAYATLQASFFSTMAARVGMTPEALYERYKLRVSARQPGGGGQVLNAEGQGGPIVYRGRMSRGPLRMSGGVTYFTDSQNAAQAYIDTRTSEDYDATDANVMRARLALRNPASEDDVRRVAAEQGIDLLQPDYPMAYLDGSPQLVEALKAAGYDGAVGVDGRPDTGQEINSFAVFDAAAVTDLDNPPGGALQQRGVQAKSKPVPDAIDTIANVEASFAFAGSQAFPTNRDFKLALQARVAAAAKAAKVDLSGFTTGVEEYLVRMALADGQTALRTNANAVGWYNEKVTKALRLVSLIHPEVATDPQAKFAFVWAMAVTSNGLKVDKNFELAETVYRRFKETGSMPTDVGIGTAAAAINRSLGLYNTLVAKHGFEVVERFMTTMQTAGEVTKFTGQKVNGENKTTMVYGAAALGPKIGNGFFMNLYGRFEQLTMDRWLMRTWGRWTGTLVLANPAQVKAKRAQLKALIQSLTPADKKAFEAIIGRKMTVGDVDGVGLAIWKASQKPANRTRMSEIGMLDEAGLAKMVEIAGEPKKGTDRVSFGDELRKTGNALTKYIDGQKEAPAGPPERGAIRKVFNRALAELQKDHPALTMSDFQALLWYPEKRLYDAAKTADESSEAYEDDEAPDYANAAAKLARAQGVSDSDITAALTAVDAELQAAVSAGGVRPGERGPGDSGATAPGEVLEQGALEQPARGTFSPEQILITLGETADLSTFLHESGHFFLEVLADLASQPNAPQGIRDDMAKTLAWFGVPDLATWNGYTLDQKRPYHEKWAESFEQYLFEGKAPSVELQPLFRRFRSWLVNVYKSLEQFMRGRDLQVNAEVRQVFGRLLAVDEQIATAEEAAGMMPDFDATNEGIERLQARSLRDLKWTVNARNKTIKALQKQAADLRKGIEAEVRAEVEQQPIYRAMRWLRKGETTNEAGEEIKAEKGFRLSTAALAELYPESMLARPDLAPLKGMTAKDGLHPNLVADMFGFASGDLLVREILAAEPIGSVIEGMTDQRMLERHGDLATPEAIEAAANEAVHNEARARSLATELKSQSEMMSERQDTGRTASNGRPITVNAIVAAAKQFALDLASRRRIKDLKNAAWQHRAAEARAGKAWQSATAKGETEAAVQAKRDQLLNHYAAKALQDAQAEVKKTLEFFGRVTKGSDEKTVERGRDPDVVNAMRAILAAYGVAPRLEKSALEYLAVLEKNDPELYAALQPSIASAMNNAKPLNELTMEELIGLRDEIDAMWFLAKESRQIEVDGNRMDIDAAKQPLLERMEEIGVPDTLPGETSALTAADKRAQKMRETRGNLTRVEQWTEGMDGKIDGPFNRIVFRAIKTAADRYRKQRTDAFKRLEAATKAVAPFIEQRLIDAPEIGYVFGKGDGHNNTGMAELLPALLNTGNDSNKRKLLLGGRPGRPWAVENADGSLDTSQWDALLQRLVADGTLRKEHFDYVQAVWDALESLKPQAQEAHRKVFGRYFSEVTAQPFVDPFGVQRRGGYYPANVDPALVPEGQLRKLAEQENESLSFAFPSTGRGFTYSRVEGYTRPLMLDINQMFRHVDKVLLFSNMQVPVNGVNRLLRDKAVSQTLSKISTEAYGSILTPWLSGAARQIVEEQVPSDGAFNRVASILRSRTGLQLMTANISNALQQITGLNTAAAKLRADGMPHGALVKATAKWFANPKALRDSVRLKSDYMRDRAENETAVLLDTMRDIMFNPSVMQKAEQFSRRHGYFMQVLFDNTMSPVVWSASYSSYLDKLPKVDTTGMTPDQVEELLRSQDREAVLYADGVVRQTQGSNLPEDVSRFERGPGFIRLFNQFAGYFNMQANTNASSIVKLAEQGGLKKNKGRAFYIVMMGLLTPIWLAEAIAQAFKGGPDDEDEDGQVWDDWLRSIFGMGTFKGLVAMVPAVGPLISAAVNRVATPSPADDRASVSPVFSVLESAVGGNLYTAYQFAADKDISEQRAVRDAAMLIGLITGVPAFALARPAGYLAGLASEDIEPTGPVDMARGLVTGTASPESKQR